MRRSRFAPAVLVPVGIALLGYVYLQAGHSHWVTISLIVGLMGLLCFGLSLVVPMDQQPSVRTDIGVAMMTGVVISLSVLLLQLRNAAAGRSSASKGTGAAGSRITVVRPCSGG
jgi:hypothetical protein